MIFSELKTRLVICSSSFEPASVTHKLAQFLGRRSVFLACRIGGWFRTPEATASLLLYPVAGLANATAPGPAANPPPAGSSHLTSHLASSRAGPSQPHKRSVPPKGDGLRDRAFYRSAVKTIASRNAGGPHAGMRDGPQVRERMKRRSNSHSARAIAFIGHHYGCAVFDNDSPYASAIGKAHNPDRAIAPQEHEIFAASSCLHANAELADLVGVYDGLAQLASSHCDDGIPHTT